MSTETLIALGFMGVIALITFGVLTIHLIDMRIHRRLEQGRQLRAQYYAVLKAEQTGEQIAAAPIRVDHDETRPTIPLNAQPTGLDRA